MVNYPLIMCTDLFSSIDGARRLIIWFPPFLTLVIAMASFGWRRDLRATVGHLVRKVWSNPNNLRYNGFYLYIVIMFIFILVNNLLGLTPFTYTLTRNLLTVRRLGVLIWLGLLISGFLKFPKIVLAHLAPRGAPLALQPLLVIIELVRILIRPLTLTVRLVANISAGHIVLGLIANTLRALVTRSYLPILLGIIILYNLFEFFVGAIQAYIFTLLLTLYSSEHPYRYSLYKAPNC